MNTGWFEGTQGISVLFSGIFRTGSRIGIVVMGSVLFLTVFLFSGTLRNDFTNLDDDQTITDNPLIRETSAGSLKTLFTERTIGHYHPLTDLTFMLNYRFSGLNPFSYHLVNLILHLLCILLVYRFILLICNKIGISAFAALLFAIHPMHTEPVAWLSARSTLMYSLFYLLALNGYVRYLKSASGYGFYLLTILFSFLAMLSKSAAATIPLTFFLIDYFFMRKLSVKLFTDKIPFIILSVAFGLIALHYADDFGSLGLEKGRYHITDRIFLFSYSMLFYFTKLLFPAGLSVIYPKPVPENGWLPIIYYISPVLIFLVIWLFFRFIKSVRIVIFGLGFFLIGLVMVSNIVSVGNTIAAERYAYLPYVGIFYIAGEFIHRIINDEHRRKSRAFVIGLSALSVLLFSVITKGRCGIWKDGETLFTKIIQRYQTNDFGFYGRGVARMYSGNQEGAERDFTYAIMYMPVNVKAYNNRACINIAKEDYHAAITDLTICLKINPDYGDAYINRGYAYYKTCNYDLALNDLNRSAELLPDNENAFFNRALVYIATNKYDSAFSDFDKAIKLKPHFGIAFFERASLRMKVSDLKGAVQDFSTAVLYGYNNGFVYYNLGNALRLLNDLSNASGMYDLAIKKNPGYAEAYNNKGIVLYMQKEYRTAIAQFDKAIGIRPEFADAYHNRANSKYLAGDVTGACEDWQQAIDYGFTKAIALKEQHCTVTNLQQQ
ncbi:MAG: tetratricopeptide repeat protein [Bacteroidetes bacterium]|nr:tetratricopeptide repeat protein [Bacteroidota bacterium]